MAKLSSDGKYVTVEKGDTLSEIARDYGNGKTYKQLAAINDIENADLIFVGQKVYLSDGDAPSTSTSAQKVTIKQFGLQADYDDVLFVTWAWSKDKTKEYQVDWDYYTANKVWFHGTEETTTKKQSLYTIPSNAKQVRVRIKPIAKTKKEHGKDVPRWQADWTDWKKHTVADSPPETPPVPTVALDGLKLTAEVVNLKSDPSIVEFEIVKNDASVCKTGKVPVQTSSASYSATIAAGGKYKVRCRANKDGLYSEWSDYSANLETAPSTPSKFTKCEPKSLSDPPSIYLEWAAVDNAKSYDIEYATSKSHFDTSEQVYSKTGVTTTSFEITSNIVKEKEYFFRMRAVNDQGNSGWSEVSSTVIGSGPAAPTTWSSTTTAVVGEPLNLYWVHNSEDGSLQKYAELEITINGVKTYKVTSKTDGTEETYTVKNLVSGTEETYKITYETATDAAKTKTYTIKTSDFAEGAQIDWRVRTAGVSNTYGDYSIVRTVIIYAPASLELMVHNSLYETFKTLDSLPIHITALASPNTQRPTGYYLTITANESYETVDNFGNDKIVSAGDQIFARHFDISDQLNTVLSANDLSLENGASYTLSCVVSMNSGLTAESSFDFDVSWADEDYYPNAEISVDRDAISTYICPYCERNRMVCHRVQYVNGVYTVLDEVINGVYGEEVPDALTPTEEQVYYGVTSAGEAVYYCFVAEKIPVTDVYLAVYRREFDGSFTEIISGLDGAKRTFVTDPHPALDYARYRIVSTSKTTGKVVYYDPPGQPVGVKAAIIQWDEQWSSFDSTGVEDEMAQQPWSGSMLKLPYNIDVSNKNKPDVSHVEYIGRKYPVGYYGTQLGETATWSMTIKKGDVETLYALRRLSVWNNNVYVREPSGSGYWASVVVSYNQDHCELTVPVTIEVTRVEGGV